jgi:hypothetical protein
MARAALINERMTKTPVIFTIYGIANTIFYGI